MIKNINLDNKINLDNNDDIDKLRKSLSGTMLYLNGRIFSFRDAAHNRIKETIDSGKEFPISLKNSIIYYMGPSPTRPGFNIGSCGPTSSYRMDFYLETTLKLGIAASLGKGERSDYVNKLIIEYKSPYLITIGGAGAYLAECVTSSKIIMFEDLGAEAITELIVKDFPVIVGIDIFGNNIFT